MRGSPPELALIAVASFVGACIPLEAHLDDAADPVIAPVVAPVVPPVVAPVVAPVDADPDTETSIVTGDDRAPGMLIVDDEPAPVWDDPWRDPWADSRFGIEVFHDEHELDEIDFDEDLETIFGDGIGDVERERIGVRVTFGTSDIRAFGQLFGEEIDDFDTNELRPGTSVQLDDLWGIGIGIMGEPVIERFDTETTLHFIYRAEVSVVNGEGRFTDNDPMTVLSSSPKKEDLGYFDDTLLAGIGLGVRGWRPSLGLVANFIYGGVDDGLVTLNSADDLYFEAFNAGLFGELAYEPRDERFRIGARGTVGDIEGLKLFLSGRF